MRSEILPSYAYKSEFPMMQTMQNTTCECVRVFVGVCFCVCLYVCVCVCLCACAYACVYVCAIACGRGRERKCVCVNAYVREHAGERNKWDRAIAGGKKWPTIQILVEWIIEMMIQKLTYSLLHLECHFLILRSQSIIKFCRSLLPPSVEKRPRRLRLNDTPNAIGYNKK